MQCPQCQNELDGTPKFCNRCGSKIDVAGQAPPTEASVDPFIGKMLGGKYKITKLLGEGGMGAVYLGEQTLGGTARKVAIKTLHSHLSRDPKILARFERECGTVAELQHPNTIQLYDFGKTDDDILYMVMEYVQGESLASILEKQHALDPARVERILQQICDALGEAHALGIIHRDLKPDNIVLTERAKDWVKVLDFGIAKRSEAADKDEQKLTQQGTVLGTPPYMSPEQFTGKPINNRSDIYSIGVMAYEMLAGRLPFNATTPWEWATQHMTVAPQPLTTTPSGAPIPASMRGAVAKALEKDAEQRFATTKDFFDAFSSKDAGALASPAYAATPPQGMSESSQKGKTQVGAPLEIPGGYGPPPGMGGAPMAPMPTGAPAGAHYGTPDAGAHAMPTPIGIPHPPPRSRGGGGKGALLGIAGFVGVLSIGAVLYAVAGHRTSGNGATLTTSDSNATATPTETTIASSVPTDTPVDFDAAIDPLKGANGGGGNGGHVTPPPRKEDGGKAPPTPSNTTTASTPPKPPLPPPPQNDPLPCQRARAMQNSGLAAREPVVFQQLRLACLNAGGRI